MDIARVAASEKLKAPKEETNPDIEALEGLDTLANLAILGDGDRAQTPSSQAATTKHPRHRPGCSCIVCIQPPSGKGPKHKQTCTCNVCLTVKRRFKTLMMRRGKKQSERAAEGSGKKQRNQEVLLPVKSEEEGLSRSNSSLSSKRVTSHVGSDGDLNKLKTSDSPFRGQIDLNIQPEREDEMSAGSDPGGGTKIEPLDDATVGSILQHIPPDENQNSSVDNTTTNSDLQEAEVLPPPPAANG